MPGISLKEELEFIKSGTVEIISEDELLKKLEESRAHNRPLNIKYGADPSAPDIHLGHTVPLRKLKAFQGLGHNVIFIIGDFTAMIGDPSGKHQTRKRLTREEVNENARTYKEQIQKILDVDKLTILFNSSWFDKMSFNSSIDLASRYTVSRMLERDDFSKRFKNEQPISILEFMYPLIQGYDSIMVKADVELGGTDQKFNFLVGRDLQRSMGQAEQVIITMPILEGTDGVHKMSKSLGNYIGLNEPPKEIFGKVMSIPDGLMLRYYELLTDISKEELKDVQDGLEENRLHPREVKADLGARLVGMYHGKPASQIAREEFDEIFKEGKLPRDIPVFEICVGTLPARGHDKKGIRTIVELLTLTGLAKSNSQAMRLIDQGGVKIGGERVTDRALRVEIKDGIVIQVGKRNFVRLRCQDSEKD